MKEEEVLWKERKFGSTAPGNKGLLRLNTSLPLVQSMTSKIMPVYCHWMLLQRHLLY